jgi:hypothetical protein
VCWPAPARHRHINTVHWRLYPQSTRLQFHSRRPEQPLRKRHLRRRNGQVSPRTSLRCDKPNTKLTYILPRRKSYRVPSQRIAARAPDSSSGNRANLQYCLIGNRIGCRHNELQPDHLAAVRQAEYQANLQYCLTGNRIGCRHDELRGDDATAVAGVESGPATPTAAPSQSSPACAENGSCYGHISAATGRPKTVPVDGYYRSDGTYVRGYYRSARRR